MIEVEKFERVIADYFDAPYAIAVDCCTHALELCLRYLKPTHITCPKQTYVSVPMTFIKLGLPFNFTDNMWRDYYYLGKTNIIDAAVYWKEKGYIKDSFMCISFQYKKHLKLGRGGMILLDNSLAYDKLIKMRYDGRQNNIPWMKQDIDSVGYHYYMTPETASLGIERFNEIKDVEPERWSNEDYPDLSKLKVFANAE